MAANRPVNRTRPARPEARDATPSKTSNKTPQAHVRLDAPDNAERAGSATPQPAGARAKLPHERDQSVGMTDGVPSPEMQQAHRDVARGVQDTDRGPPADRAYQKQKVQKP